MKRVSVFLLLMALAIHSVNGQTRQVRVMSYNIMNGFDFGKDSIRQAKTAHWIQSMHPDIVALQELCDYSEERLHKEAAMWGHQYSILLKTKGYSVGLTSNKPIQVIERKEKGMWHGMLYCEVEGIHVFVVHFSPDDYRFRGTEADTIFNRIQKYGLEDKNCIVLGDFNASSPFDDDSKKTIPLLLERNIRDDKKSSQYKNMAGEYYDYSVLGKFLAFPLIDICQRYISAEDRFTYSSPILIGRYRKNMDEVIKTRQRLDYIMATPLMARYCVNAFIGNGKETGYLSDHYPVIADFSLPLIKKQ